MNRKIENSCKGTKANRVLLLIFILFITELIYISSNREQTNKEYQVLNQLKSLKTIHQRIDGLFNRDINHQSFDSIVEDTKEFGSITARLQNHSSFSEEHTHLEYDRLNSELMQNFKLSEDYIERYKSWSGLTINSTRILYDLHGNVKKLIRKNKITKNNHGIEDVLDEIIYLVSLINYDRLSEATLIDEKIRVLKSEASVDKDLQKHITNFSKHITVILEGHELMQALKEENDLLKIGTSLDKMYKLLLQDFKEKDKSSTFNLYLLNALVLILLFVLFMTSRKESKLHQEVCVLNHNLEDNIKEIKSVNGEMEKLIKKFDANVIASSTDKRGVITYVTEAFCKVSGYTKEELLGKPHNIVRHSDVSKEVYKDLWKTIQAGQEWSGEIQNCGKNGDNYWVDVVVTPEFDENHELVGYSAIRHLITTKKELEVLTQSLEEKVYSRTKELEEMITRVEKLSVTDELTGLYNRRYYTQVIENEMKRAQRRKVFFGYLILDIDNFKLYNDYYGHQLGDSVLQKVSKSLVSSLARSDDFVFRMGGEEFIVLFTSENIEKAVMFAQKIIRNVKSMNIEHIHNVPYNVITLSGGLVLCGPDKACFDVDSLYKKSDQLLYEAKAAGRNCLKV